MKINVALEKFTKADIHVSNLVLFKIQRLKLGTRKNSNS